jgi:hypothetical protein
LLWKDKEWPKMTNKDFLSTSDFSSNSITMRSKSTVCLFKSYPQNNTFKVFQLLWILVKHLEMSLLTRHPLLVFYIRNETCHQNLCKDHSLQYERFFQWPLCPWQGPSVWEESVSAWMRRIPHFLEIPKYEKIFIHIKFNINI